MTAAKATRDPLSFGRVVVTLVILLALALVLPFAAVKTLHARRVDAAERDLEMLAGRLAKIDTSRLAQGTEVLVGPGSRPHVADERWNSAASQPLARALALSAEAPVDPWGNAYLVVVDGARRPVCVLSAGADGILETPFSPDISATSGDDRAVRVRIR